MIGTCAHEISPRSVLRCTMLQYKAATNRLPSPLGTPHDIKHGQSHACLCFHTPAVYMRRSRHTLALTDMLMCIQGCVSIGQGACKPKKLETINILVVCI